MNERIQELRKQAFDTIWDLDNDPIGPGTHFQPNGFEEKFAELIINECISAVEDTNDRHRRDYFAAKIKQHFGIQE
jgi:hypothetical protein